VINAYLASRGVHKLNVGAGETVLPGWLNTDRDPPAGGVYLDVTRPFPLPTKAFDYVFTEHMIEHLSYRVAIGMLHECHRVLKPGGRIRVATPDLRCLTALHANDLSSTQEEFVKWTIDTFAPSTPKYLPGFVINHRMRAWGHRFIYDPATLELVLTSAGFVDCRTYAYGESDDPELARVERHGYPDDVRLARFQTLVMEAERP
jgi:predicted SAM-dependent methyltransferase